VFERLLAAISVSARLGTLGNGMSEADLLFQRPMRPAHAAVSVSGWANADASQQMCMANADCICRRTVLGGGVAEVYDGVGDTASRIGGGVLVATQTPAFAAVESDSPAPRYRD